MGDFIVSPPLIVKCKLIRERALLPSLATSGSTGFDIRACEKRSIDVGERVSVSTGITLEMPNTLECQVRPRSGLALKHGVTVLNAPGTIDSDYRGEIKVILINLGSEVYDVGIGDRIAQLVFASVVRPKFEKVDDLNNTERGENGFGSTGLG